MDKEGDIVSVRGTTRAYDGHADEPKVLHKPFRSSPCIGSCNLSSRSGPPRPVALADAVFIVPIKAPAPAQLSEIDTADPCGLVAPEAGEVFADHPPMRTRTIALLAVAGCTDPELVRPTDLASLEVASFDMYIGSFTMWGDLRPVREPADPCAVLGTDFHARVGKLELSAYAGGREESCNSADGINPCSEPIARCEAPFVSLAWPPPLAVADLVVADRTREIHCALGDAFAARTMTRVPDGSWEVVRGETVTSRVSPGNDVSRFAVEVYFIEPHNPQLVIAPHTVAGDTVSFAVPSVLSQRTATLYVHIDGYEAVPCDVPARALHSYVIEQPVTIGEPRI